MADATITQPTPGELSITPTSVTNPAGEAVVYNNANATVYYWEGTANAPATPSSFTHTQEVTLSGTTSGTIHSFNLSGGGEPGLITLTVTQGTESK